MANKLFFWSKIENNVPVIESSLINTIQDYNLIDSIPLSALNPFIKLDLSRCNVVTDGANSGGIVLTLEGSSTGNLSIATSVYPLKTNIPDSAFASIESFTITNGIFAIPINNNSLTLWNIANGISIIRFVYSGSSNSSDKIKIYGTLLVI